MAETGVNQHKGPGEECGEIASSCLLQPAGTQEIEKTKSGTFVIDVIQTLEIEEENTHSEEQQLGQKKKSFTYLLSLLIFPHEYITGCVFPIREIIGLLSFRFFFSAASKITYQN